MRYLLDTNIIPDLAHNPHGQIARRIALVGSDNVTTSIIVPAEITFGLAKIAAATTQSRLTTNVCRILDELPIIACEPPADEY